jgi:hypothetical protein
MTLHRGTFAGGIIPSIPVYAESALLYGGIPRGQPAEIAVFFPEFARRQGSWLVEV